MKKILLPILTLASLLFVSCQMEEPGSGKLTGEVDFSVTAEIPNGIMTYTPAGTGSHNGGAVLLDPEEYTLRYTLEVYEKDGTLAYEATENAENGTFNGVTFDVRLLAKTYDFVFWADFVKKEGNIDFYNVADLKNITYQNGITVQDLTTDAADAYYGTKEVNLAESNQTLQVTLRRPFGKIRLLATDNPQNIENQNSNIPVSATIAFTDAKVPTTFNARTGEASEPTLSVTGYTFTAVKEPSPVVTGHSDLAQEGNFAYLLGQTYFFESPVSTAYKMTVTVNNATEQIGYRELTNIPVSANKLTTVIGNFYTNEGNIDVIVEDEFGNGENVEDVPVETTASTLAEAESALEKLAADPTIGDKDIVITIPTTPASGDNSNTIEMPALSNNVTIVLEGGISADGLIINDVLASGSEGNDFTGNLTIKNNSTDPQGNLTINLPAGSFTLDGGSYSSMTVTTADNTFVVGEDASIGDLTVNKGNVKLYGTIESLTKAQDYSGTIYRCLSTQKSLENLLSDNVSGYEKILIEIPATIDGGTSKPTLAKPVDIYADANISNVEIAYNGNGSSPMNIYDGALNVNLSNVKMSTTNESSICKLMGSNLNFKAVDCEFILTQGKSNQSGINIQNGGTGNVISAELDGCYIGFYNYEERINKDLNVDYDYPSDFKWSSYSRGITTGNNSGKTYDGTATTNLTIKNTFIEGAYYAINTLHNIKLNVDVENSVLDGRAGFNIWTTSEQPSYFNVRNSKLIGRNGFSGPSELFGTIVINGQNGSDPADFKWVRNINVVVDNSDIVSDNDPQTETNIQYIADIRTPEECSVKFVNGTTLREIKNPRMNFMVSMNYWNYDVVYADESVKLEGKEGVLLMPQKVWDGQRKTKPHSTSEWNIDGVSTKFYDVVEVSDLVWLAEKYNEGSDEVKGISIMLYQDLDLNWHEWTPIKNFSDYFIAQEFEIRNLKITSTELSDQAAGLIGTLNNGAVIDLTINGAIVDHISAPKSGTTSTSNGTAIVAGTVFPDGILQNVAVRNAQISGNRYLGGIAGYVYGSIIECEADGIKLIAIPDDLTGSYDNGDKVGGIVGYSAGDNNGSINGNTAKNITITGYRDLGGIAGAANSDCLENNSVENINITVDQLTNSYGTKDSNAGYVLGRNLGNGELNSNNNVTGDNSITEKK